jgi:HEAT repeat protein
MKLRYILWAGAVLILLAVAVLLIPGSPFYVPDLLAARAQYDGHPTSYWIEALDSPDGDARSKAAHALGAIGIKAEAAVPALAKMVVEDPNRAARIEAALALKKMAPASREAVPALAKALEDKEPFVRHNAANALFALGVEARPVIPALIKAFQDKANKTNLQYFQTTIQEMAALALGQASKGTAEAVPALTEGLRTADTVSMRMTVARALGAVGAPAGPAVPEMRKLLKDKSADVRFDVARALGDIGAEAKSAVPDLQTLLKDQFDAVRDAAAEALEKIQGKKPAVK